MIRKLLLTCTLSLLSLTAWAGSPEPIVIVECLANLTALPSECFLIVLPLKLHGADGSPVRAIALLP